jgi:hypothetical protein
MMELKELSEREMTILELMTSGKYFNARTLAEKTDSSIEEIVEIIVNKDFLMKLRENKQRGIREKEQERKNNETKILEAICDNGCTSIQSIHDVTKISYYKLWQIIKDVNLLPDLRETRKQNDYELVKKTYRPDMRIEEMIEKTGLSKTRVHAVFKKAKEDYGRDTPLSSAQKDLATQILIKRAEKEDPAFYQALIYYKTRGRQSGTFEFEELYQRYQDIYEGHTCAECGRRWGVTKQAASQFIKSTEIREIHRERVRNRKERLENEQRVLNEEQQNLENTLNQRFLKRAKKEDPVFYYAFEYCINTRTRMGFDKIYARVKDILDHYSAPECSERWGICLVGAYRFIKLINKRIKD